MPAACSRVDVAQAVDVGTGYRAADLIVKREETADGDLRQLRGTLHVKF